MGEVNLKIMSHKDLCRLKGLESERMMILLGAKINRSNC